MRTLDPIERKKLWAQMDDAARKLGVPSLPKLHIGMLVEKDGKILTKNREEGHSWTRNMWNIWFTQSHIGGGDGLGAYGAGYISAKRDTGHVYSEALSADHGYVFPVVGAGVVNGSPDSLYGIVVGTSDTAFSVDDYILGAKIAHGNGTGQLAYQAMAASTRAYDSNVWTGTVTRVLNNNSGGAITVKEVGMLSLGRYYTSQRYYYLLARDVLGSPVSVANGAQLTVTYETSMDFTSIDT